MTQLFSNKHIIVTGGANGIGRCISEAFMQEGAKLSIIDLDKKAGEGQARQHKEMEFFHGDIGDKNTLEKFVKSLTGPVDCLINNACLSRRGLLSECSWDDFEYVLRVGLTAPFFLTALLLKAELLTGGAAIVNIASTRAAQSQADTESYTAAKGGILALTHAMAVSLAGKARVNSISPGWIDTAMYRDRQPEHSKEDKLQHPAGRVGRPQDIAEMVLYLCSEKAAFITGENITIDGGMSHLMIYHGDRGWKLEKH